MRLLYGATPSEDIINYNVITRALTEWTATNQSGTMDQTSIAEGIGGYANGFVMSGLAAASLTPGLVNVRQNFIQGIDRSANTAVVAAGVPAPFKQGTGVGNVPNQQAITGFTTSGTNYSTRRYQVQFSLGMFNQDKLVSFLKLILDSN